MFNYILYNPTTIRSQLCCFCKNSTLMPL